MAVALVAAVVPVQSLALALLRTMGVAKKKRKEKEKKKEKENGVLWKQKRNLIFGLTSKLIEIVHVI